MISLGQIGSKLIYAGISNTEARRRLCSINDCYMIF